MRIYRYPFELAESVKKDYVRGFPGYSGKLQKLIHRIRDFSFIFPDYQFCRFFYVFRLIPVEAR